jgi:hypothetical protein|tara:strand:+ start:6513 stop:6911 length:399 start_codon:yes stop_codon:yes gene_type:complete
MSKTDNFKLFNNTYFELLSFIKDNSNKNKEYIKFYNKNLLIKKTNIKYLIKSWYIHVTTIYYEQIMKGDISFFLNKDYSEEKKNVSKEYIDSFEKSVIFLKNIYETLEPELLHIFLDYIKKITYYSYLYYKK